MSSQLSGLAEALRRAGRSARSITPGRLRRLLRRPEILLIASAVVLAVVNYSYTVIAAKLLPVPEFSKFAALAALLLFVGTCASASVPWVLAKEVRSSTAGDRRRRDAVAFALLASCLGGAICAGGVVWLARSYASPQLLCLGAVSCLGLFCSATGIGYLQGHERFSWLVVFRLTEVAGKAAAGVALIAIFSSAEAAVGGIAVGVGLVAVGGLLPMRKDLARPTRRALTGSGLWSHTFGIGLIQVAVAFQQAVDSIVLGTISGGTADFAGYQAMAVVAKVPFFVSVALSLVVFPRLVTDRQHADPRSDQARRQIIIRSAQLYAVIAGGLSVGVIAFSGPIAATAYGDVYSRYSPLLPPLALAGFFVGFLNLTTTYLQAKGEYQMLIRLLLLGSASSAAGVILVSAQLRSVAWISAVAAAILLGLTTILVIRSWFTTGFGRLATLGGLAGYAAVLGFALAAGSPAAWLSALLAAPVVRLVWLVWRRVKRVPTRYEDGARATLAQILDRATRDRAGRPARVLLVGNYGNGNTGDETILAGLLDCVQEPDRVVVVSRDPRAIEELHGVRAVRTVSLASLREFLLCDAVCVGGGGMFGLGLPPLVRLLPWVMLGARMLGLETYFLSIGVYPDVPAQTRLGLQLAAATANAVTTRERGAAEILSGGLARGVAARAVGDPSRLLTPAPRSAVLEAFALAAASPLIVNVKAIPDEKILQRVIAELAAGLLGYHAEHPLDLVVLAMSDKGDNGLGPELSDLRLASRIGADLGAAGARITLAGPGLPPALAKGLCASARGVIAMRLHAQIFAVTTGVPVLGICVDAKSREWLAEARADRVEAAAFSRHDVLTWLRRLDSTDRPLPEYSWASD